MISERHAKILEERGLDIELLEQLGVASDTRLGSESIAIPYFEAGIRINTKYRTIAGEKRFTQETGARQTFYNQDVIADQTLVEQPLIICEGEFDTFAALQAGFGRVVSVPNGAPPEEAGDRSGERYRFLTDSIKMLDSCREIILAVDADGPGIALLNDLALRLGRVRCKWVKYPKDCKDLGDALRLYGQRGVTESINRAQWMEIDGLYRMSELPPLVPSEPHMTGFPGLDAHYRIRTGDLTVVTGQPSAGKSVWLNDIACRMAQLYNWQTVFASFEQIPQIDHKRALRTWYGGKMVIYQTPAELARADDWIDRNFLFVSPGDDDDSDVGWLVDRLASAVIRYGAKMAIIDPWNEIQHDRPEKMTETEYVGDVLRRLKRFARKHQVHLVVAAHPAKLRRDADGRYPVPTLYDISGSAHFYNRCDVGIIISREDTLTTIRVAKSRYHDQIGEPGETRVRFIRDRQTYERIF